MRTIAIKLSEPLKKTLKDGGNTAWNKLKTFIVNYYRQSFQMSSDNFGVAGLNYAQNIQNTTNEDLQEKYSFYNDILHSDKLFMKFEGDELFNATDVFNTIQGDALAQNTYQLYEGVDAVPEEVGMVKPNYQENYNTFLDKFQQSIQNQIDTVYSKHLTIPNKKK